MSLRLVEPIKLPNQTSVGHTWTSFFAVTCVYNKYCHCGEKLKKGHDDDFFLNIITQYQDIPSPVAAAFEQVVNVARPCIWKEILYCQQRSGL